MSRRERNREIVRAFGFEQKHPDEAADPYVGERYIQHNPLRVIADEEPVAVRATIHRSAHDRGIVLVDSFRLEDVGMPMPDPATVPHDNGVL